MKESKAITQHEYKNYVGEPANQQKKEGVITESLGECLSKTRELAEWPDRILKQSN